VSAADLLERFAVARGLVVDQEREGLAAELEWQERGLCAQTDPESFFPEKGGSTREAKRTCMACEVRVQCLDYALTNGERFGIWGGLSERERRRVKKRAA
jgi:WhiB family transcriptional regulator, redox-sensing transcriptional regulator